MFAFTKYVFEEGKGVASLKTSLITLLKGVCVLVECALKDKVRWSAKVTFHPTSKFIMIKRIRSFYILLSAITTFCAFVYSILYAV